MAWLVDKERKLFERYFQTIDRIPLLGITSIVRVNGREEEKKELQRKESKNNNEF